MIRRLTWDAAKYESKWRVFCDICTHGEHGSKLDIYVRGKGNSVYVRKIARTRHNWGGARMPAGWASHDHCPRCLEAWK